MTARGCGRDALSETEESLPSHSRSGCPAGRLRAAGQVEVQGRAADEAAARRTMTGLPFSGCESGRLREAPTPEPRAFGLEGKVRQDTGPSGSRTCPGGKRDFGQRVAAGGKGLRPRSVGQDRASAWGLRTGGPSVSAHGPSGGTKGFGPRIPAGCGEGASALEPRRQEQEAQAFRSAERRTARASALSGSPRGNPIRLRPGKEPRRERWMSPRLIHPFSKPPRMWNASPPRLGSNRKGQWGPAAMPAPIILRSRPEIVRALFPESAPAGRQVRAAEPDRRVRAQ